MKPNLRIAVFVLVYASSGSTIQAQLSKPLSQKAVKVVRFERNTDGQNVWLSDSKVMLTLPGGKHPEIYDIKSKTTLPLPEEQKVQADHRHEKDLEMTARFQLWGTHRSTNPPVPLISQPPLNAFIEEAVVSPDHTAILWVLVIPSIKLGVPAHSRIGQTSGKQERQMVIQTRSFWLSKSDGTALHHLVDVEVRDPRTARELFVEWLPNGKRISFEYHDTLYTMAVPR